MLLIHPPVAKPCEPPAGVARLAAALQNRGYPCTVLDASLEGLLYLLDHPRPSADRWSLRAIRNTARNLALLRDPRTYRNIDRYKRAVSDLTRAGDVAAGDMVRLNLANYQDRHLSPVRSTDILRAAENPEGNPFHPYFSERLRGLLNLHQPQLIGFSVNFLSQVLCAFAMIGFLKRECPGLPVVVGGGLITSWMSRPDWKNPFAGLVDHLVSGPGEGPLLELLGLPAHAAGQSHGILPPTCGADSNCGSDDICRVGKSVSTAQHHGGHLKAGTHPTETDLPNLSAMPADSPSRSPIQDQSGHLSATPANSPHAIPPSRGAGNTVDLRLHQDFSFRRESDRSPSPPREGLGEGGNRIGSSPSPRPSPTEGRGSRANPPLAKSTVLSRGARGGLPLPDYHQLPLDDYLSPGVVLPYSASTGCYWNNCSFCPEKAEGNPYRPILPEQVTSDLRALSENLHPALIHLLDNALSPSLMESLCSDPPGTPWYGFARVTRHLADDAFCTALRRSGCVMLKLGLESGDQEVIDKEQKGIDLETASLALKALKRAGIGTYVYLLFGTPAETAPAARKTLDFTVRHADAIDFLNLAIFNMPIHSPDTRTLDTSPHYDGDLSLYTGFTHPEGWDRSLVRQFLDKEFRRHPAIAAILRNEPPTFTSNHAPFFCDGMGKIKYTSQ